MEFRALDQVKIQKNFNSMKKSISYNKKKLSYKMLGKGQTVVLIHGFAEDREIWNELLPAIENKYQLILPDLPGSGESDLTDDISIESMGDWVEYILKAENITKASIIGHSMGGYITLSMVEKNPGIITAFGLFHSTAYADNEEKKAARRKSIKFIESHGSSDFIQQALPPLCSEKFRNEQPLKVEELLKRYNNFNPLALIKYYEAMILRPDRTEVLKKTDKPILFIVGKHDNTIPFDSAMTLVHLPALSYIHILENSGHMGMIEEPDKCIHILTNFLDDLSL